MYFAALKPNIIMFQDEYERDSYVTRHSGVKVIDNIREMQGDMSIVLCSCLNCAYCSIEENILSRSLVCRMKGGKVIASAEVGENNYFDMQAKSMNNPYFLENHCTDFIPINVDQ